jgi:hypothetical protein
MKKIETRIGDKKGRNQLDEENFNTMLYGGKLEQQKNCLDNY